MEDELSRRDLLKGAVAGAASAVTSNFPEQFIPQQPEGQEVLKTHEPTVVADIFADETDPEIRKQLLENMTHSVDVLKGVDLSQFTPEDKDAIFTAIETYRTIGDIEPLQNAILDQLLLIGEGHGNYVEEKYQSHLEGIDPGNADNTTHVGIQNATTGYHIEADALGITARITVDPELLRTQMEAKGIPLTGRVLAAFQFGEINVRYNLFNVDRPKVTSTNINGQEYVIWGPAAEEGQQPGSQRIDEKLVPTARNVLIDPEYFTMYPGDSSDTQAVEQFTAEIENQLYERRKAEVISGNLSEDELARFVHKTSVDKRITYQEPYNNRENFLQLNEFARSVPDMVIVHAAGNNTDLRPHEDIERATNAIIVSGIGGLGNKREEKFGTPPDRLVGGIGADIYVRASDFREITNYLTASEATGIIGAYVDKLQRLGITVDQMKEVLKENCCDFFASEAKNLELKISQREFAEGYVFNQEKAQAFIKGLETSMQS